MDIKNLNIVGKVGLQDLLSVTDYSFKAMEEILMGSSDHVINNALLFNDTEAFNKPTKTQNRKHFDAVIDAVSHSEKLQERDILVKYFVFYVNRMIKMKQEGNVEALDQYLPRNTSLLRNITPEDCVHIVHEIGPGNERESNIRPDLKHAFSDFVDMVLKKNIFKSENIGTEILRKVKGALADSLMKRTLGKRFYEDELFINKFDKTNSSQKKSKPGSDEENIPIDFTENSLRKLIEQKLEDSGYGYRPLKKSSDAYLKISAELDGEETFVLPLGKTLFFKVENLKSLISKKVPIPLWTFELQVFVPTRINGKADTISLLQGDQVRIQPSENKEVIFEITLDGKIVDPGIAKITLRSITPRNHDYKSITETVIIIPEAEEILKVRDSDYEFQEVLEQFVNSGKMNEDQRMNALGMGKIFNFESNK